MYLFELFTNPVEWEVMKDNGSNIVAVFNIDEKVVEVYLSLNDGYVLRLENPDEEFRNIFDVHFATDYYSDEDGFRRSSADWVTGSGDALQVFSTVIEIIQTTVKKKNIQHLYFTADNNEPSRVKLYNRLAKAFAKDGWRYIDDRELKARSSTGGILDPSEDNEFTSYFLTRQHPHEK